MWKFSVTNLVKQRNHAGGVKWSQLKKKIELFGNDYEYVKPDDAVGHEELCTVDDESGEVTEEKDYYNTDKDAGKIHLVVGTAAVAVGSNMGVPTEWKLILW